MRKNTGFSVLALAFIANFWLGFHLNFYRFDWFDTTLHFLGGLGVYIVLSDFLKKDLSGLSWLKRSILLIGASVVVGVLWEFAEYSASVIWPSSAGGFSFIGDLADTLADLALDITGASFGAVLHLFRQRKA